HASSQESKGKEEQQRAMKIALRSVRSCCREASLPAGTPSERNRQHDGETRSQRVSRPNEIEMPAPHKQRNATECQIQSCKIKQRQDRALPRLDLKQPARLCIFHVQVQQQRGQ